MKCDRRNFHSEAENFQICYQMQTGENPVNKDQRFISEVKCEVGNGKSRNLAYVGKEIFELQHLNLTNFAKGNSINAEYYFEQFL